MAAKDDAFESMSLANASMDDLLKYETWLLSKREDREKEERIQTIFKTVDTFAGITKKRMWVKNAPTPYTDGWEIGVPLSSPHAYEYAEHEIAHNLFQSNFKAKELFCAKYVEQIETALKANGKSLDASGKGALGDLVGMFLNILEDHRVNSLWSLLYPGSYHRLQDIAVDTLSRNRKHAHTDLVTYFLMVAYDLKLPAGNFDRFRPAMVSALQKVDKKGPSSSFVVGKWLMTQLVSEIIRTLQNLPPPPDAGSARVQTDLPDWADSDDTDTDGADDADGSDSDASPNAGGSGNSPDSGGSKPQDGQGWQPPDVNASTQDRVDAMQQLVNLARAAPPQTLNAARERLKDVHDSKYPTKDAATVAANLVKAALDTNVSDPSQMDLHLARSEAQMVDVIEDIREALEQERKRDADEWITRDAHAKVVFSDVDSASSRVVVSGEDSRTVARLRGTFQRVKSRRAKQLSDSGHEIDLEAYIANKMNGTLDPVFKTEGSQRGFKALVLVDRSSSMVGPRTESVERAARILRRSLKQPNVEFHVWGFQGEGSTVKLCRVNKDVDIDGSDPRMKVHGTTPIHIATRTAINWLGQGDEKKQLIILTDGEPCFSTASGRSLTDDMMRSMVQKEIARARKQGINVTSLVIGDAIPDKSATQMFGIKKHWARVKSNSHLCPTLVRLVTTSFQQYLSNG